MMISAPRMIQNLTVRLNATSAEIDWHKQEGPMLKIDMRYVFNGLLMMICLDWCDELTTPKSGQWRMPNRHCLSIIFVLQHHTHCLLQSLMDRVNRSNLPNNLQQLKAVCYTDYLAVRFNVCIYSAPGPPQLIDTRALNAGDGAMCEIEWKPPKLPNGRIIKYYVNILSNCHKSVCL